MDPVDLADLTAVAIEAARAAGAVIRAHVGQDVAVRRKAGGDTYASQVLTKVDLAAEAAILRLLRPTCLRYDLALLSEERPDDGGRHEKDYFWCVDPLDGTLAFVNGTPGFSVAIALVARDGTPHIGVVFDPSAGHLYHAARGRGAFKDGLPWQPSQPNPYLTYVTDKRLADTPQADVIRLSLKPYARPFTAPIRELHGGGAVLNAIHVAEQGPAVLLKPPKPQDGGGSLWDYAATACLYHELGLPATDYAGRVLDLNRRGSTFMNHAGVRYVNADGSGEVDTLPNGPSARPN